MHSDLVVRHRALVVAARRYTEADLAWRRAAERARGWFPPGDRPAVPPIGNPGSPLRRLWDSRARAADRLALARLKLEVARARAARRRTTLPARRILVLADART